MAICAVTLVMPLSRSHRPVLDRAARPSSPESTGDREQPADTAHTRCSATVLGDSARRPSVTAGYGARVWFARLRSTAEQIGESGARRPPVPRSRPFVRLALTDDIADQ